MSSIDDRERVARELVLELALKTEDVETILFCKAAVKSIIERLGLGLEDYEEYGARLAIRFFNEIVTSWNIELEKMM